MTLIHRFFARIEKAGINPYVSVPLEISQAFSKRGNIPVKGTLNNIFIKATLVPVRGGAHRLYINGEMRKKAGIGVGDFIDLRIEPDMEPRILPVPEKLQKALEKDKRAKDAFEKLPPSHRNEILAYLNYLKTPAALDRNVNKVIDHLLGRKKGKPE